MTPDGKQKGWLEHPTSWPREATPSPLVPMWAGEFRDFSDWVSFAAKRLTGCRGGFGQDVPAICVDAIGRRCSIGGDFMRARDEGTFPVRYFWQCQVPVVAAIAERNAMPEALEGLQQAEAEYRRMHDLHGDGSQAAGRAWDLMRRAGDNARRALNGEKVDG